MSTIGTTNKRWLVSLSYVTQIEMRFDMSAWDDFLAAVKAAEAELGNPPDLWYRGHTDESWSLIPSLLRISGWDKKERALLFEFKKTASRLFDKRSNDWEVLFDMQHYWIPTRLLDWTTVMGVAIAFILHNEYSDSKNSALYILDPTAVMYPRQSRGLDL